MELEFEDGSTLDAEQSRDILEAAQALGMTLEEYCDFVFNQVIKPDMEQWKEWKETHSEDEVETAKQMFKAARESERAQQDAIRKQIKDALP